MLRKKIEAAATFEKELKAMAFYLRKAKKIGPFRINFSKSGIGISGGVTGARIGINSQGKTYVHGGRHGMYYRKNLGGNSRNNGQGAGAVAYDVDPTAVVENFHSKNLDNVTSENAKEFLEELQLKANRVELWKWAGVYPSIVAFIILYWNLMSATSEGATQYVILGAAAVVLTAWSFFMRKLDSERKGLEVIYQFNEGLSEAYYDFIEGFNKLSKTQGVWEILSSVKSDGSGASIDRELVKEINRNKLPTPYLKTNIEIPYIRLKKIELFFLPERLILRRGKKYAAVNYSELTINRTESLFTESQSAPGDAKVERYTWLHTNKNGEPDRRYKHNPKLPVCNYTKYHFKSSTGLNELLMTSNADGMDAFIKAIEGLANNEYIQNEHA